MADDAPTTTQVAVREPHYAAVGMATFGHGALPMLQSMADVVSIAQLMAKSQVAVPKHLRDNPGACLSVTMQALRWNADPFAVANKSFSVNDRLAYEAQMLAAVINTMAPIKGRPDYSFSGADQKRKCKVSVETRDGQVLDYETPEMGKIPTKNSPLWKADPDQQLGYYAIRSLARRHFPEVILGIYDRDEMEASEPIQNVTPRKDDLRGKLKGPEGGEGFSRDHVAAETGEERPDGSAGALEGGSAGEADTGGPVEPEPEEEAQEAEIQADGHAGPGEVYLLAGGEFNEEGKRLTYKDGIRFSTVTQKGAEKLKVYGEHSPEVQVEEEPEPEAEAEEAEPAVEAEAEAEEEEDDDEDQLPDEFRQYIGAVEEAKSWVDVKKAMAAFYQTPLFKEMTPAQQNKIRANTWDAVAEATLPDKPDQAQDVSAFRLWIEWVDDAAAIEGTLAVLERETGFAGKDQSFKATIRKAAVTRIETLKG